jgi:hypothetical protein
MDIVRENPARVSNPDLIDSVLNPPVRLVPRVPIQRVDVPEDGTIAKFCSDSIDCCVMSSIWRAEQLLAAEVCSDDILCSFKLIPNFTLA